MEATAERRKVPPRTYDASYKQEAVKLSEKLGVGTAARELGIPENTLYAWVHKNRKGELPVPGQTPRAQTVSGLADEVTRLKAENRELKRRLAEEEEVNEILNKAARFFALSQKK
jgi:transposase